MGRRWHAGLNFGIFLLFVFSSLLYTYKLSSIPTSFHGDEGETGFQALAILEGNLGLIGVGWFDIPLLSFVPHVATMAIVGPTIVGERLGSVIFGLLTIPVFYLFTKELFKERVALVSTLLLATSHLWIALSRFGTIYTQATFLMLTTLYFLFKALKTQKLRYFLFTGIFLGLSFYSYYAVRILPLIMVIPVLQYVLKSGIVKKTLLQIGIVIISAIIIFSPQAVFFLRNPEAFTSRTNMVYIYSTTGRQWANYNKNDLGVFIEQTKKTFNIFAGDNSTQYGYKGQLLDWLSIIFLIIGTSYLMRHLFSQKYLFLLAWLGLSLLGQVLTTIPTPVFLPRFVVGLPVLFIIVGLGIDKFYSLLNRIKGYAIARAIISVILIFIAGSNIYTYFISYPKQIAGDPNARAATKISSYLNSLKNDYAVYFLTEPLLYPDFGTIKFITNKNKSVLGTATYEHKANGKLVYIIYPHRLLELWTIRQRYPDGKIQEFKDIDGHIQFYVYRVE